MRKFIFALFAVAFMALTSCSSTPSEKEVDAILEKCRSDEYVSPDEYSKLIDYFEAIYAEMEPLVKEAREAQINPDTDRYADAVDKMRDFTEKHPCSEWVIGALENGREAMGPANYSRFQKTYDKLKNL